MNVEILMVALLTAMSTSLVGVFLVLRRLSMLTDAISHTVLLGIVIAFMVVGDMTSPFLVIGATVMGVVTVYLIEMLIKTRRVKEDASIGVVFTFLFSISVIIISTRFRHVHLDINMVLLGNLEFVIFDRFQWLFIDVPTSLFIMGLVFVLNITLLGLFYKEMKLVSFDYALAGTLGFSPLIIHYVMMTLVSLTAVAAFNAVGAILVIALMIGPPITALFLTKTLFKTILLTMGIAVFNSVIGYQLSRMMDVTISGMIASMTLLTFVVVMIFARKKGLIGRFVHLRKQKEAIAFATILVHIKNHEDTETAHVELDRETMHAHMQWRKEYLDKLLEKGRKNGYLKIDSGIVGLTEKGESYYRRLSFVKRGVLE